jgi:hypothetical protein
MPETNALTNPFPGTRHEHLRTIHQAPGRHGAAHGGCDHHGVARLFAAADFRAAGGRFPDDPGHRAVSRREPGRDDFDRHDTARASVRTDQRADDDDLDQLVRNTAITLQFALDRDIDAAAQDVQAAINAAGGVLPRTMPNPPTYSKVNPSDQPILTIALTSDSLPLEKVNDLADTLLAQKLSEVTGVGLVTIEGNQKPAVRVRIDPAAIASLGLGLEDVRAALIAK